MAHRVFRLSIRPLHAPEVLRVVDFDGRDTLHDVHGEIQRVMKLDNDHLYAFYLSGRYFDVTSEYGPSRSSRRDSGQALLFRLGLRVGQELAYLFDFGDELRHAVTVVSITDVDAPLPEPVLVESVGDAPPQYGGGSEDFETREEPEPLEELAEHLKEVEPLVRQVLELSENLDSLYEADDAAHEPSDDDGDDGALAEEDEEPESEDEQNGPPEAIVAVLRQLSEAALKLAAALEEDEEALLDLDDWSGERELLPRLAELPLALVNVGELESALAVARAFTFAAAEPFQGDVAIILAESGKRDESLAQLDANLQQFPDSYVTAMKSGEAFEALGDVAAAEASYRRGITLADGPSEREEAVNQLIGFLEDLGRGGDLDEMLYGPEPSSGSLVTQALAAVGRNEPCPCGSGKKYKKCHGV